MNIKENEIQRKKDKEEWFLLVTIVITKKF